MNLYPLWNCYVEIDCREKAIKMLTDRNNILRKLVKKRQIDLLSFREVQRSRNLRLFGMNVYVWMYYICIQVYKG